MTDLTVGQGSEPVAKAATVAHYEKIVDCAAVNLAVGVHELFDIPAGMLFLTGIVEVLTAEGGTATADIGDTDVDAMIDGANLNAAAGTVVASGDGTGDVYSMRDASAGTYYSVDTTVNLNVLNALDAAVFRVKLIFIDLRNVLSDPVA